MAAVFGLELDDARSFSHKQSVDQEISQLNVGPPQIEITLAILQELRGAQLVMGWALQRFIESAEIAHRSQSVVPERVRNSGGANAVWLKQTKKAFDDTVHQKFVEVDAISSTQTISSQIVRQFAPQSAPQPMTQTAPRGSTVTNERHNQPREVHHRRSRRCRHIVDPQRCGCVM